MQRVVGPLGALRIRGTGDIAVAALATAQNGVVSRAQLEAVGLGRGSIARRVANGRLHRLHRGVYAVGHQALPPHARETAALLACGATAVLSHRSAAAAWGLLPKSPGAVDVTVPSRDCRPRAGIRAHTTSDLPSDDVSRLDRLPLTTVARTLVELAGEVETRELERALDEAAARRLATHTEIRSVLRRAKGRSGTRALRDLLDDLDGPRLTRSEAERRLLALLRVARLPLPQTNVRVGCHEVDALWQSQRLVVEVDGYAFHSSRAAFERDRLRDSDLQARGLRVVRITWRQLSDEPEATVARIARVLGAAGP
ncbi:MAG TPA: type IV toxin-antitoxin system AbiEi family antitoxin domain-containing protein [Thermoleophilaceae bacterium]|nr:type IV toxin-antitoxin system AbiEi family antitoxin domain-containing protein [Thermoleophilaceae bacterium]